MNFVKRLFGFPELRDWLLAAGFTSVAGYGEDARPLNGDHRRMIIIADLPSELAGIAQPPTAALRSS
jgi:hypothetical protein